MQICMHDEQQIEGHSEQAYTYIRDHLGSMALSRQAETSLLVAIK